MKFLAILILFVSFSASAKEVTVKVPDETKCHQQSLDQIEKILVEEGIITSLSCKVIQRGFLYENDVEVKLNTTGVKPCNDEYFKIRYVAGNTLAVNVVAGMEVSGVAGVRVVGFGPSMTFWPAELPKPRGSYHHVGTIAIPSYCN